MAETQLMAGLAQRLRATAAARDWHALGQADRDLAAWLACSGHAAAMSASERAALQDLQQAHQRAQDQCAAASDELAQRLSDLRCHKDGWLAYTLNSDMNDAKV